jgi:hypothetical protein
LDCVKDSVNVSPTNLNLASSVIAATLMGSNDSPRHGHNACSTSINRQVSDGTIPPVVTPTDGKPPSPRQFESLADFEVIAALTRVYF